MPAESDLHASLKKAYLQDGAAEEVLVDGYWIDVVSGDLLIEIQTRNFYAIKPKLGYLLNRHPVRLVHPIPAEKWIVLLSPSGNEPITRRKSPRRGRFEHLFLELIRFPQWINHPNFSIEVVITREEEIRRADGRGSWRRGHISIVDRKLLSIVERRVFSHPRDFLSLVPTDLPSQFTNRMLAQRLEIPIRLAAKMNYCLRAADLIRITGKNGRSLLFTLITE